MFRIEKMFREVKFEVVCREHHAKLECDASDLHPTPSGKFAYACPICGQRHTVSKRMISRKSYYDLDVKLDDPSLPVNILKQKEKKQAEEIAALKKELKKLRGIVYKRTSESLEKTPAFTAAALPNSKGDDELY